MCVATLGALASAATASETVKIGTLKISTYGALFIAVEKGYFAAEGITPELHYFQAAQPIPVALAGGALDFGVSGTSGTTYSLGGQGAVKIIGGGTQEVPGFRFFCLIVNPQAYAAGLKSYKDLPGHAVAVSTIGAPSHYSLVLIEEKYGLDPKSIRVVPIQSVPNQISAMEGRQTDATMINASAGLPVVDKGQAKLLGFVGDEVPWQVGIVYTSTKIADGNPDLVQRFLRAYKKGAREYHDAIADVNGKPADGPNKPEVIQIIAKSIAQTPEQVAASLAYLDADGRLDVKDILHQIAWFKSEDLLKIEGTGESMIDTRYVVAMPAH